VVVVALGADGCVGMVVALAFDSDGGVASSG